LSGIDIFNGRQSVALQQFQSTSLKLPKDSRFSSLDFATIMTSSAAFPAQASYCARRTVQRKLLINTWFNSLNNNVLFTVPTTISKKSSVDSRRREISPEANAELDEVDNHRKVDEDGTARLNNSYGQLVMTPPPSRAGSSSYLRVATPAGKEHPEDLSRTKQVLASTVIGNDEVAATIQPLSTKRTLTYRGPRRARPSKTAAVSSSDKIVEKTRKYYKADPFYDLHLATVARHFRRFSADKRRRQRLASINDTKSTWEARMGEISVMRQPRVESRLNGNANQNAVSGNDEGFSQTNDENANISATATGNEGINGWLFMDLVRRIGVEFPDKMRLNSLNWQRLTPLGG
jgi:hypothetical protein